MYVRSQRAEELARKLAERTGKSVSEVVEEALDAKLESLGPEPPAGKRASLEELLAMARECSRYLGDRRLDVEDLYDEETGLPK